MNPGASRTPVFANPQATAQTIQWILRGSVFLCFVGHGAFGILQKNEWLAFVRPFGFSDDTGLRLMPLIGCFDIAVGCLALVRPTRLFFMINVVWGIFTAGLRPLAGLSFFEVIERAGNYGPAFALLIGTTGGVLLSRTGALELGDHTLSQRLRTVLMGTTFLLLLGHGGLALMGKPLLMQHWASIGLGHGVSPFTQIVGCLEILAAFGVLFFPGVPLCLGIFGWKLFTELLFVTAGAPFWEVVERGGSYGTPLALACLIYWHKKSAATESSHQSLNVFQAIKSRFTGADFPARPGS